MSFYHLYILDLDGTLVDSRADIVTSVNLMIAEMGGRMLPPDAIHPFIGRGITNLVRRSLGKAGMLREADLEAAVERYHGIYAAHLLDETVLYPGVMETLEKLRPCPAAVVTNKSYRHTIALLKQLGLVSFFRAVLGGDSLPRMKPSPEPILYLMQQFGVKNNRTLVVGDSIVDMEAGKAAGAVTCLATYGFTPAEEQESILADRRISRFEELLTVRPG